MKSIVYGQDERVMKWVGERLDETDFGPGSIAIGLERDGELIAGVVYNMYSKASICMNVAAVPGKDWLSRSFLYATFAYPFVQLKCNRVTALVKMNNEISKKFVQSLGWKPEGCMRKASTDGQDMLVYGMLREECRWIGVKP